MNLIVWPDQANKSRESVTGQVTSVLEGMTLTYPSIYLSLQSLSAYESCGSTTRAIDPATTVPTFFPFDPSDISTITWSSSAETFTSIVGTETIVSFTATWGLDGSLLYIYLYFYFFKEDARNSAITGRHRDYHKNNDNFVWIYIIVYNIAGYTNFLRLDPITDASLHLSNFRDIQLQKIYERNPFNHHQSISHDWCHFKQFKYVETKPDIRKADQLVFFQHIVLHFQHQKLDISLDSFHFFLLIHEFFHIAKLLIYHSIFFIFKFSSHIVIVIPFPFVVYSHVSFLVICKFINHIVHQFYILVNSTDFQISEFLFFSSYFFILNAERLFIAGINKHLDTNLLFCHIHKLFCIFIDPSIRLVNIFIIAVQLDTLCNISSLRIHPFNSRTQQPVSAPSQYTPGSGAHRFTASPHLHSAPFSSAIGWAFICIGLLQYILW
ncbi:hypothetical protein HDK77DRAFT_504112 [Phyllosticta capitalensis]